MLLCEAAGCDIILIETVGVGQSETTVRSMVDFFLLVVLTGAGDELQGIKKGIMELADAIVINKADGDNLVRARVAKGEYERMLEYIRPATTGWTTHGAKSLDEVKDNIRLLAQAAGEEERGRSLVEQMDEKLADIRQKTAQIPEQERKSVVLISVMSTYGGSGCTFDDACRLAGVVNGRAAAGLASGQPMTLLLSGVVVGMLLAAVTAAILTVVNEQKLQQYLFWTIGGLDYRRWEHGPDDQ